MWFEIFFASLGNYGIGFSGGAIFFVSFSDMTTIANLGISLCSRELTIWRLRIGNLGARRTDRLLLRRVGHRGG